MGLVRMAGGGEQAWVSRTRLGARSPAATFGWLWVVFFLQGMTPGFWFPALTNLLRAHGMGEWVAVAFAVPPLCALVSPLIGGALADQRVTANRLFAWTSLAGALALGAAFWCLDQRMHPHWFIGFLAAYSIVSGPSWGLLTTVALTQVAAAGAGPQTVTFVATKQIYGYWTPDLPPVSDEDDDEMGDGVQVQEAAAAWAQ